MKNEKRLNDPFELKPCPFCGSELVGKNEFWRNKVTGISRMHTVYAHPANGCILEYKRFHFYAQPNDVEKWNRRAEDGK